MAIELVLDASVSLATLDHGHRQAAGTHNLKLFTPG